MNPTLADTPQTPRSRLLAGRPMARLVAALLLLAAGPACIEVETLKEQREAECRATASPGQYARSYQVSTTCDGERSTQVTVSAMRFVEVDDPRSDTGVRQYFRGEFEGGEPFWDEGRIEVECTDGSAEAVLVIPASAVNSEYRCFPTIGGSPECSEFNTLSMNPAPAGCTATVQ